MKDSTVVYILVGSGLAIGAAYLLSHYMHERDGGQLDQINGLTGGSGGGAPGGGGNPPADSHGRIQWEIDRILNSNDAGGWAGWRAGIKSQNLNADQIKQIIFGESVRYTVGTTNENYLAFNFAGIEALAGVGGSPQTSNSPSSNAQSGHGDGESGFFNPKNDNSVYGAIPIIGGALDTIGGWF